MNYSLSVDKFIMILYNVVCYWNLLDSVQCSMLLEPSWFCTMKYVTGTFFPLFILILHCSLTQLRQHTCFYHHFLLPLLWTLFSLVQRINIFWDDMTMCVCFNWFFSNLKLAWSCTQEKIKIGNHSTGSSLGTNEIECNMG